MTSEVLDQSSKQSVHDTAKRSGSRHSRNVDSAYPDHSIGNLAQTLADVQGADAVSHLLAFCAVSISTAQAMRYLYAYL